MTHAGIQGAGRRGWRCDWWCWVMDALRPGSDAVIAASWSAKKRGWAVWPKRSGERVRPIRRAQAGEADAKRPNCAIRNPVRCQFLGRRAIRRPPVSVPRSEPFEARVGRADLIADLVRAADERLVSLGESGLGESRPHPNCRSRVRDKPSSVSRREMLAKPVNHLQWYAARPALNRARRIQTVMSVARMLPARQCPESRPKRHPSLGWRARL